MALLFIVFPFAGCDGDSIASIKREALDSASDDVNAPVIEFTPPSEAQPYGQDVLLTAIITDETTILAKLLHFRAETTTTWSETSFMPSENGGDEYVAKIGKEKLRSAGMHYYIEAVDTSSNLALSPVHGAEQPYHFRLTE